MKIVNLTQFDETQAQILEGVFSMSDEDKAKVRELITFEEIPTVEEMRKRAHEISFIAYGYLAQRGATHAMISGAPYFAKYLEQELRDSGLTPIYSFSKRRSETRIMPDGSTKVTAMFEHAGWVLTDY